ncbi:MAG TPA: oligosaccharide flippase family protein [Actinomycetota bacterium]|nr:oligosaccharide flippase family protein [Actinomycetota bacterium]
MGVAAEPSGNRSDYLNILSGTSQNIVGIVVAAAATFVVNILMSNALGPGAFGVVTVATQAAFVVSFATRAGMDMAVLRDVAVEVGEQRFGRIRVPVARATMIGALVSAVVAVLVILAADQVRQLFSLQGRDGRLAIQMAALGLPFLALANVWLSATRGLKIMRYTLYVFWAGQPIVWIVLMLAGWLVAQTSWMSALAYSLSWVVAAAAAGYFWKRESAGWDAQPMESGEMSRLFRYAGPRAPAALFSQLLFWTDLFVLTRYATDTEVGVYSAALRAGQVIVLFLTSVSLMFSPFVADLHNRGETERLDKLFKTLTRWTIVATMPAFLLLLIAPEEALRIFGARFSEGEAALLILIAGQFVNIATGSVGFVLIMVGRTGWDLLVYAGSLALNLGLAFWLCPRYGMEGAAIANAVTFALSKWARLALVRRFVHIQPYDRLYGRLIVPSVAALGAMWLTHRAIGGGWLLDLAGTAVAGFVVYGILYLLVGLTAAERKGASSLLASLRSRAAG